MRKLVNYIFAVLRDRKPYELRSPQEQNACSEAHSSLVVLVLDVYFQKSIYYFRPAILCLLILGGLVVVPFFAVRSFRKFLKFFLKNS